MVEATVPSLPSAAPRYLMGVGRPEQILQAVVRGVDMFDCVIPSRHARHGTVFVQNQAHLVSTTMRRVQYEDINLRGAKFKNDFKPISKFCSCITCRGGYTRAYLRHLFAINDPLAQHLAVVHNLFFYMQLMAEIRVALAK